MRKAIQKIIYLLVPLTIISAIFLLKDYEIYSNMGTAAFLLVTLNLFIKPMSVITPVKLFKVLMTYRREIGVLAFWMFVGHFLGLYTHNIYTLKRALNPSGFIIYGVIAGIGMFVLGLTSNNAATQYLKRNWKKVQKIAYPTYFLILVHSSLAEDEIPKIFIFGGTYLVLKYIAGKKTK